MFNAKPIISKWVADMYDQNVIETDDVDFLLSIIGTKPKRILEVCCGTGRILLPLAKAGHNVCGLDFDKHALSKLKTKTCNQKNVQWRAADAVYDDWGTGFDIVVLAANILYNIVSNMDYSKAQELFIHKAASSVVPGGYVYIEYAPGGHFLTQSEPSYNKNEECIIWEGTDTDGNRGKMILLGNNYNAITHTDSFVRKFELTLKNNEVVTQEIPWQRHFAPLGQLHDWLDDAGFTIEQEYSDIKRNPVNDKSKRVYIYARKN